MNIEYNQKNYAISLKNYDIGKFLWTKLQKQNSNLIPEDYSIVLRDALGECHFLDENDYIFDLISTADMLKYVNSKWFVRRHNWNELTPSIFPDCLYFLQYGSWIPFKCHSCSDDILSLYYTLQCDGLINTDNISELNVKQIYSQLAAKDVPMTRNLIEIVKKLPYFGSIRYSIKSEFINANNLVLFKDRIQFLNNDKNELTIPIESIKSCIIENQTIKVITGSHNDVEHIFVSTSRHCIKQRLSHLCNDK